MPKLRLTEDNALKRAAALIFYNDPEKFITGAYIKIGYFKEDADLIYQDEIHGNLFHQVKATIDLLTTKYLKALITYEGIQRIETLPIPLEALREALLNAIVHKSYESLTPIQIGVYDDKLEIWNCGTLPDEWTIKNLLGKHRSRPYNPDIANVFFRAGEIEAWGRGIERMILACKKEGCPEPKIEYDGGGLWTIFKFKKIDLDKKNARKTTQKTTQKTGIKLTKIQEDILQYLQKNPQASRKELTENIKSATEHGIKYNLERLKELGLIKRIGADKGGYWEVRK